HAYLDPHHPHPLPTRRSSDLFARLETTCSSCITVRRSPERPGKTRSLKSSEGPSSGAVLPSEGGNKMSMSLSVIAETTFLGQNSDRKSTRLNSSHVSISYAVF